MALGTDASASEAAPGSPDVDDVTPGDAGPGEVAAPEEAIEGHLREVLKATQTQAGAVCLFDQHQELLRLAVEVGLSDEGCRRLRNVRRGSATTWDMPLHSLLNRRAYLIESAAKNRYVPPLVDNVGAVRAVACIPLCDGSVPVGSLILVALAPQTFGERQVRLLERPVRELVGAIVAMRKRVGHAAPSASTRPSLSRTATTLGAVTAAGPTTPGAQAPPSAPAGTPASVQAAVDRARAEIEKMRARASELDEQVRAERAKATALESEVARIVAEREALSQDLRHAEQTHRHALQTAASEHAAERQALEAKLVEAMSTRATLESRIADLERHAGGHDASNDERVATAVSEAEARAAARLADVEAILAGLRADHEAIQAELANAEARHAETIREVEARTARALTDADARAAAAIAEAEATRDAAEERCARATAAADAAVPADAIATVEAERDALRAELVATQARVASLDAEAAARTAELEARHAEIGELREALAHLEALAPTPTDDDDEGAAITAPFEVVELASSEASLEVSLEPLPAEAVQPPVPEPPAGTPPSDAAITDTAPEGLLVIDTDPLWSGFESTKSPVTACEPTTAALLERLRAQPPERLLLNLGAPGALDALVALRAAGVATPCYACIRQPNQPRALLVGRLEAVPPPLDPDSLLSTLKGTFARGTRVVTAGADVDALISLRQALSRLGASVSMAWDAKQVADLIAMVRPEVALIDLDLPPKDGTGVVARLGLATPPPLAVIIPKTTDCAPGFVAALAHPELGRATLPAKEVVNAVLAAPVGRPV